MIKVITKRFISFGLIFFSLSVNAQVSEYIDRGEFALPQENSTIFISWRLLKDDSPNVKFDIFRLNIGDDEYRKINNKPIAKTNYLDTTPQQGRGYRYRVEVTGKPDKDKKAGVYVFLRTYKVDSFRISLQGTAIPRSVGIADLDGDGRYDFVVKLPNFNVDPYEKPGYWKKSPEPFKLEAYNADGKHQWTYDMGWAIETGVWYSPYLVYDIDGDGFAEIYTKAGEGDPREIDGHVMTGPEYLVKINGKTGKIEAKTDWLSRKGFSRYNTWSRNFLSMAYLDGKKPSILIERGTYGLIKLAAYDLHLKQEWYWESSGKYDHYRGQGQHTILTADIDDDNRDEIIIGMAAIDDDGTPLWTKGLGHNDVGHIADIDPDNPGLEIFYGMESSQKKHGVGLLDARTGKQLWAYEGSTVHVHGRGMIGDIDPTHPGMECYAGEAKGGSKFFLYSSKGELLSDETMETLDPIPVWWDADDQKEILINGKIVNFEGDTLLEVDGKVLLVGDIIGDWREEIVTGSKGNLKIYSSTIPTEKTKITAMQDRQYRLGISRSTMGYPISPQLGRKNTKSPETNEMDTNSNSSNNTFFQWLWKELHSEWHALKHKIFTTLQRQPVNP